MAQRVQYVHLLKRISKRVRKETKVQTSLLALHNLAVVMHNHDKIQLGQTTEYFLAHHTHLSSLDGDQINEICHLAFAAGGYGPNPNISSQREAMATVDKETFEESMDEEIVKCFDNGTYGIVKCSTVLELKSMFRAVRGNMRKTTPDGHLYPYRSRICTDGSTQNTLHKSQ